MSLETIDNREESAAGTNHTTGPSQEDKAEAPGTNELSPLEPLSGHISLFKIQPEAGEKREQALTTS